MISTLNRRTKSFVILPLSILLMMTANQRSTAQAPVAAGVDHVGMNVPNMNAAVRFFKEVLGFEAVTEIGPLPMDAEWKTRYRIHQGASLEKIVMMRAGNGANVELFQYKSAESEKQQSFGDDAGYSHLALYTNDLPGSVKRLTASGVKFLNAPIRMSTGPTAGETWVYFLTPWGSKIELVSYPEGKAYERIPGAAKLWSPKEPVAINNAAITKERVEQLVKQHLAIWSDRNGKNRNNAIQKTYAKTIGIIDPDFQLSGLKQLDGFIDGLQKNNPGFNFSLSKPYDAHNNVARVYWQFGPASNPAAVTGMDIFIFENGLVQSLYIFLDKSHK